MYVSGSFRGQDDIFDDRINPSACAAGMVIYGDKRIFVGDGEIIVLLRAQTPATAPDKRKLLELAWLKGQSLEGVLSVGIIEAAGAFHCTPFCNASLLFHSSEHG